MIHQRLRSQLDRVAARYKKLRTWQALACAWLVAAVVALLIWAGRAQGLVATDWAAPLVAAGAFVLAMLAIWGAGNSVGNYQWVAQRVEAAYPELRTCLLAAIEQRPERSDGRLGYLQVAVIQQALRHSNGHPWPEIVPQRKLALAALSNLITFTLFVVALAAVAMTVVPPIVTAAVGVVPQRGSTDSNLAVTIEPGNVEVERGASLLVLARVQGPMPAESTLVVNRGDDGPTRIAMSAGLEDPVFGGRIPAIHQPLDYHVELADQATATYRVTVFDYPRLERADARLVYPDYTGLDERLVQDVRTISVVEGTKVTLRCLLNKPVAEALLVDAGREPTGEPIRLAATADAPLTYETTIECRQTRRFKLELLDDAGRKNIKPAQLVINVVPNQAASLKPVFPARDLEVSALEELELKATVWDDFGVRRSGLSYSLGGKEPVDVVLSENAAGRQKHELHHIVSLEELEAEADQLLSYHWWAEDVDAAGQVRRTSSDMYFAEVRPFDEIFRQGQQPTRDEAQRQQQQRNQQGGEGANGQAAQQLAQLQKDIINATWKLIRREIGATLSNAFSSDVEQVASSQTAALDQAVGLEERLRDERSKEHLEAVLTSMRTAAAHLKSAQEGPAREPLQPALAAEQAAYQSLLKLRAREHEIVRQQQQQQRGQQNSRQQDSARSSQQRQQLQQLDLRDEENRYESQRTAQQRQEESAEERENRQVLNRLRELARRQHDLNERLKELQSALEEARDEQRKEEVRRQLARLQEEQRQVLQDTDELQSRLDQPENSQRMAEERQQLEETRDQVQRASEALEQEMVTRAAAAGTRAEQQFDDLREEFRRRAANRFSDEMRQMRDAARQLEERESEVSRRLNEANQSQDKAPSLREDTSREEVAEEVKQQRQRLAELQDQMRDTVQRAEETEPVLTNRLYDATRNLTDRNVDRTLQQTERSLRQGLLDDARQQEADAGQGIRQLREGIERAAEGVLGDGSEALRRAREELRDLRQELQQEIQRNAPEGGRQESDERQPGQQQPGQQQPGQQQPGQQQPGQQQPGQQQPGQDRQGRLGGERREPRQLGGPVNVGETGPLDRFEPRDAAPIAGEDFRNWSDRLRDVEEMVDSPELRSEAARIRERARQIRAEQKRHSAPPNWDLVREQVAQPLVELEQHVSEELLRRTSKDSLVPLDRDPVPPQYSEKTRRYYERLGSGK